MLYKGLRRYTALKPCFLYLIDMRFKLMLNKLISMQNYSDEQLIARYLKGDEESLEFLIKKYLQPIYNFVCRYVDNEGNAKDITQEIFVKVWKNLKKFDQKRNFKTWIFSIAKNASIDFLKKEKNLAVFSV